VTGNNRSEDRVAFWEDPAIRTALLTIGGGIVGFATSARIVIPYQAHELAGMAAGLAATVGGTIYLVRRIQAGLRGGNTAKRVTFTKRVPRE